MTFSPDDEFRVDFTVEPDVMPGCLLIYEPDQSKVSSKFHFMACSEVMSVVSGGYSLLYRLTNRITGEFEMCDGSMKVLPVCGKCCREWTRDNYTADNFSIIDFFRKYGEAQIPEDVFRDLSRSPPTLPAMTSRRTAQYRSSIPLQPRFF